MDTNWFRDAIIYHIFIDRFSRGTEQDREPAACDGPEFCGGNLQGVIDRLDYLVDLGINTILLSPFTKATSYHGYDTEDLYAVDPRFGSLDTLKTLIHEAHARDIKIIADFVANHVSVEHPFFRDARENADSEYRDWFYFKEWPDTYLSYWNTGTLPKLNFDHGPAREHVIGAARMWTELGIDGLRLDHAIGPPFDFWRAFKTAVKSGRREVVLIGEVWDIPDRFDLVETIHVHNRFYYVLMKQLDFDVAEQVRRQYTRVFDGLLDFEFQKLIVAHVAHGDEHAKRTELFEKLTKHYRAYREGFYLPSFLDTHDTNRFLFECGGDVEKLKEAARIQFAQKQPPIIYYGTEAGMNHEKSVWREEWHADLEARSMMVWERRNEELFQFYKSLIRGRQANTVRA